MGGRVPSGGAACYHGPWATSLALHDRAREKGSLEYMSMHDWLRSGLHALHVTCIWGKTHMHAEIAPLIAPLTSHAARIVPACRCARAWPCAHQVATNLRGQQRMQHMHSTLLAPLAGTRRGRDAGDRYPLALHFLLHDCKGGESSADLRRPSCSSSNGLRTGSASNTRRVHAVAAWPRRVPPAPADTRKPSSPSSRASGGGGFRRRRRGAAPALPAHATAASSRLSLMAVALVATAGVLLLRLPYAHAAIASFALQLIWRWLSSPPLACCRLTRTPPSPHSRFG